MPYVQRNQRGEIDVLYREPRPQATEYLDNDDPQVTAFLHGEADAQTFEHLDARFVRVLEDLVDILLERHLLVITDLPPAAQAKWLERKQQRSAQADSLPAPLRLSGFADIIDDTGFGKL